MKKSKKDVRQVIQGALSSGIPLIRECENLSGKRKASLIYRRAKKYLENISNGKTISRTFLNSSSAYELSASALLSCPIEDLVDLICTQAIPLPWIASQYSEESAGRRAAYIFWYNRVLRDSPAFRKNRRLLAERNVLLSPVSERSNFFEISEYEFAN